MSAHTPGPWVIKRAKYGRGTTREIWGADGVCVTGMTMRMTHGITTEANAKLIAAAPRMKAALDALVVNYAQFGRVTDHFVRDVAELLQEIEA